MEEKNSVFSDEMFELLTRYTCETDRADYNERRAELLGLGGRHVRVAPGAIIRIPKEQVGSDVFIGLYTYLNGDVTIGDHVLIGPHCTLPAGNTCLMRRRDIFPPAQPKTTRLLLAMAVGWPTV